MESHVPCHVVLWKATVYFETLTREESATQPALGASLSSLPWEAPGSFSHVPVMDLRMRSVIGVVFTRPSYRMATEITR